MTIEFWQKDNGIMPAESFLSSLDNYVRLKVVDKIESLSKPHWSLDNLVNTEKLKHLERGLYELRVKVSRTYFRFPVVVSDDTIYLLDGFKKQKNRIEQVDINRARNLYQEYQNQ